jgi:two-component system, chemotaxis family, chemotaxis protein CheY
MEQAATRSLQKTIEAMKVLVVDDEQYMRKVVRTMLLSMGMKIVYEAEDGHAGLESICRHQPDLVIVDWEMPGMDGSTFVRMVRSPRTFPFPDVPIIMLSGHGDRWRVVEAAKLGAHEYLLKPVSTKALHERIAAILTIPRPFITLDGYYGPAPRRFFNRDIARPASAQKPARPAKDAEPGANRPVAASRSLPALQPTRADRDEVVEKKVVLL